MDIYTSQLGCVDDIRKGELPDEEIYKVLSGDAAQSKTERTFDNKYEPDDGIWIPNSEEKKIAHDFIQKLYALSPSLALISEDGEEFVDECKSFGRDLLSGNTVNYRKDDLFDSIGKIYESFMGFYLEKHGERAAEQFLKEDYVDELIRTDFNAEGMHGFKIPDIKSERMFRSNGVVGKADVFWEDDKARLREIKVVKELNKDHVLQTLGNAYLVEKEYPEKEVDCKVINFGFEGSEEAVLDFREPEREIVEELLNCGRMKLVEIHDDNKER